VVVFFNNWSSSETISVILSLSNSSLFSILILKTNDSTGRGIDILWNLPAPPSARDIFFENCNRIESSVKGDELKDQSRRPSIYDGLDDAHISLQYKLEQLSHELMNIEVGREQYDILVKCISLLWSLPNSPPQTTEIVSSLVIPKKLITPNFNL